MEKNINGIYDSNHFECYLNVLKCMFKMKRYKQLHPVLGVVVAILLAPFLVVGLFLAVPLFVYAYAYKLIRYPIEFLRGVAHGEGQEVHAPAQLIIYLISWPIIFFFYALSAILLLLIGLFFLVFEAACYIWSLAGFEFTILPIVKDRNLELNDKHTTSILVLSIILISFVALLIIIIIATKSAIPLAFYLLLIPYVAIAYTIQREKTK